MNKTTMIRGFQLAITVALSLCAGLSQVSADDTECFSPSIWWMPTTSPSPTCCS